MIDPTSDNWKTKIKHFGIQLFYESFGTPWYQFYSFTITVLQYSSRTTVRNYIPLNQVECNFCTQLFVSCIVKQFIIYSVKEVVDESLQNINQEILLKVY